MLVQNRLLQPLDESVGPRMSRLRVRVAEPRALTAQREGPLEFLAVVREHATQLPADVAIRRSHDLAQKREDRGRGDLTEHEARPGERRGDVTAGELPDLAHAFQLADIDGVEREERAGSAASTWRAGFGFAVRSVSKPVVAALHCSRTANRARRVPSCCAGATARS